MTLSNAIHHMSSDIPTWSGSVPITFHNYIFSLGNHLVKREGNVISLSKDNGRTFTESLSVSGLGMIKMIHVFETGELMLCNDTQAFYSYDWQTLNQAQVIGFNGQSHQPSTYDNFSLTTTMNRQYVGNDEIKCWGNYSNASGTEHVNINVWYTTDKGRTVKSAIKFGTSGGGLLASRYTRHVHSVDFLEDDGSFWVQTGDHGDEPLVARGYYNPSNDNWTWELIGTGQNFKFGNLQFHNGWAYWTGYVAGGGGMKAPINQIQNVSSHQRLVQTINDAVSLILGKRGDVAVTNSKWPNITTEVAHTIYYAPDGVNFTRITGDIPAGANNETKYEKVFGVNSQGKVLSGVWVDGQPGWEEWDGLPSVWLDDIIRNAGFPNAFR